MIDNIFDINKKNIVLTGSSGFLGTHFSHILSSHGANVILIDVEKNKNKKLELELTKKYNKTDRMRDASFEKYPFELWNKTISKNLNGVFLTSKEIGRIMIKQRHGIILNISSIYGIQGPDQSIYGDSRLNSPAFYSVTKGGIVSLTRYLAALWSKKNIRVNTLTLGGVYNNKLHPKSFVKSYSRKTMIGRMAKINDYDGALLFLISNASSYMTGSNLIIDGGWSAW